MSVLTLKRDCWWFVVYHFVANFLLYRRSRFFEIWTVRGAIADASSYGFWTDVRKVASPLLLYQIFIIHKFKMTSYAV